MKRSLLALTLLTQRLAAQSPEAFRAEARAATQRFADVTAARAEGFRLVGVEFPRMGEHWVNLARVLENRFAPDRPSVLIYVNVAGSRRLAGLAYTAVLKPGETPPASVAPIAAWHEHNGSVAEESLPLHHATGVASQGDALRLAILHAWVWQANPAGLFVTDNATLPFLRRGLSARPTSAATLNGMDLAADSARYFELQIGTAWQASEDERSIVQRIVEDHRSRAARIPDAAADAFAAAWRALWTDLERALPAHSDRLRTVRARLDP